MQLISCPMFWDVASINLQNVLSSQICVEKRSSTYCMVCTYHAVCAVCTHHDAAAVVPHSLFTVLQNIYFSKYSVSVAQITVIVLLDYITFIEILTSVSHSAWQTCYWAFNFALFCTKCVHILYTDVSSLTKSMIVVYSTQSDYTCIWVLMHQLMHFHAYGNYTCGGPLSFPCIF